jgi:hypothetical protein
LRRRVADLPSGESIPFVTSTSALAGYSSADDVTDLPLCSAVPSLQEITPDMDNQPVVCSSAEVTRKSCVRDGHADCHRAFTGLPLLVGGVRWLARY